MQNRFPIKKKHVTTLFPVGAFVSELFARNRSRFRHQPEFPGAVSISLSGTRHANFRRCSPTCRSPLFRSMFVENTMHISPVCNRVSIFVPQNSDCLAARSRTDRNGLTSRTPAYRLNHCAPGRGWHRTRVSCSSTFSSNFRSFVFEHTRVRGTQD